MLCPFHICSAVAHHWQIQTHRIKCQFIREIHELSWEWFNSSEYKDMLILYNLYQRKLVTTKFCFPFLYFESRESCKWGWWVQCRAVDGGVGWMGQFHLGADLATHRDFWTFPVWVEYVKMLSQCCHFYQVICQLNRVRMAAMNRFVSNVVWDGRQFLVVLGGLERLGWD